MNKNIEAFIRGYFLFCVNDRYFLLYARAQAHCHAIKGGLVTFNGLHLWKGWRCFHQRFVNPAMQPWPPNSPFRAEL